MSEFRKQFLARLLLVAAQAAGPSQGPTNCTSPGVYMTLPIDPMGCRESRRGCGREVPSNATKLPQRSPSLNFCKLLSPYADHTLTIRAYGPPIRAYGERMVGVYPAGSAYAPFF